MTPPNKGRGTGQVHTFAANEFRDQHQVVIVGAGLVGLLLAIVLRQAGYLVTIFDKDIELKEIGAGIILPPNACRVLDQAGVLEEIRSHAVRPKEWVSHSYKSGATLGSMNLDPHMDKLYGMPFLVIHRPQLRRILFHAAEASGAHIRLGVVIDPACVDFANGVIRTASTEEPMTANRHDKDQVEDNLAADLLVAADGQQSETRAYLSGEKNGPAPTGKMVNRILIGVERMRELGLEDLIERPCIHVWLGPGSLAVGYLLQGVFNFVLTCSSENEKSVFLGPKAVDKEELFATFRNWDPRVRSLVENGHGFLKWLLFDNSGNDPHSWVRFNDDHKLALALTGDAAHAIGPYIGSGAALGFESAMVLGSLLGQTKCRSDVGHALNIYGSLRRPRTNIVGRVTQKMAEEWMLPDGPLQAKRDRIFIEEHPPLPGYPNTLQDPFFQKWLYAFDGVYEARTSWIPSGQDQLSQTTDAEDGCKLVRGIGASAQTSRL
ncbi:MAG: hypothetical protein LQ344_000153 [Seirophora lacunosa]|nr:MAG: hypothetical protein LQ344_000153 [Seirophora lacunosa]